MSKVIAILEPFFHHKKKREEESKDDLGEICPEIILAREVLSKSKYEPQEHIDEGYNMLPRDDSKDPVGIQPYEDERRTYDDRNSIDDTLESELACIVKEFDTLVESLEDNAGRPILQMCQYRIIESMVKSGMEPIESGNVYNTRLHSPYPYHIAKEGDEIEEYLRIGVRRGDKIYIKARVKLKN